MHSKPLRPLFVAAAFSACATQPEVLNSDRIKERFGSYGVAVVAQDGSQRRSSLYSVHDGIRTSRTYAVVSFIDATASDISGSHARVLGGESIGTTLREHGWELQKKTIFVGTMPITDAEHPVAKRMQLAVPTYLAMHAYELHVDKDSESLHYATIIEAHHPDYLQVDELREIYPVPDSHELSDEETAALTALVLSGD